MTESIFSGLKVLDVGTWIAGPVAATILADYGAEVIKVEIPGIGDQYRQLSALPGFPDADTNYMWDLDARNKRSLTLNLKSSAGVEILHQLVRDCDVYITNQPFPMRDALNLNYEDLKPLNPEMIFASLTAYGETGPDRDREGFDLVAYWARTGLAELVRDAHAPPSPAIPGMGDHPTAVALYASIVTALLQKERTGEGAMVHTSLLANGLWSASCIAQAGFSGGSYERFRELGKERRFPRSIYGAADNRHYIFTMVRTDQELNDFAAALDKPDLFREPPFDTPEGRFMEAAQLSRVIDGLMAQQPSAEWEARFKQWNVAAVKVGTVEEISRDQQVDANNLAVKPADAAVKSERVIDHPVNVSTIPKVGPRAAPEAGEHREQILMELGYDAEQVEAMIRDGIV